LGAPTTRTPKKVARLCCASRDVGYPAGRIFDLLNALIDERDYGDLD
jgi:hypothetical protein